MKYLNSILIILSLTLILSACNSSEENITLPENTAEKVEPQPDDVVAKETAADTSSTGVYQEKEDEENLQEAINADSETIIESEGMSFCDCVKKNKSFSDIMMADETSDADFDKAMEELKNMKTGPCKIMFPQQNNIDEQEIHRQKVEACLNK